MRDTSREEPKIPCVLHEFSSVKMARMDTMVTYRSAYKIPPELINGGDLHRALEHVSPLIHKF